MLSSKKCRFLLVVLTLAITGCGKTPQTQTPRAEIIPFERVQHGDHRIDPYSYLADINHVETQSYLSAEAAYLGKVKDDLSASRANFERELNQYLSAESETLPVVIGDYAYYRKVKAGGQYPLYIRRNSAGEEEVLLDLNELAGGNGYYQLGSFVVSGDNQHLAYTEDVYADQVYRVRVRHLESGQYLPVDVEAAGKTLAWSPDGNHLYITSADNREVRQLSVETGDSRIVFKEEDPAFSVSLRQSHPWVVVTSQSHLTTDILLIREGALARMAPRKTGHQYRVSIVDDDLFVLSNYRQRQFELARVKSGSPDTWQFLTTHQAGAIEDFEVSPRQIVILARNRLTYRITAIDRLSGEAREVAVSAAGEVLQLLGSVRDPNKIRYLKLSLLQPATSMEYDILSGDRQVLHQTALPDGYDPESYVAKTLWFKANDATEVPVTLLYKQSASLKQNPAYLHVYGSYGISLQPRFDPTRLPLLNRGFTYAFIHVRGGGELGTGWHASGRSENKQNTFSDFIEGAKFLAGSGFVNPKQLFARGVSAGGTVIGVAANQAPELFLGLVAEVPFVDVLTTLSDSDLPLTESDRLEWGNPLLENDYFAMKNWSPVDQVHEQEYPCMLVSTALVDARVGYHEPLKWLARLRERSTGDALMAIDVRNNAGHMGSTDQHEQRQQQALEYAFLMRCLEQGR